MTVKRGLRVLCIDDNADVLSALRMMLRLAKGIDRVETRTTTVGLVETLAAFEPDVVLLDAWIPDESPEAALRAALQQKPSLKVIAFSGAVEYAQPLIEAGAVALLCKDAGPDAIIEAVRSVEVDEPADAAPPH